MHILYSDDAVLVVDKPAGMLSVPGRGEGKRDCAAARVQALFADALVVYRLDMATSGLLLMARGSAAQRKLGIAFAQREVEKRYVAVVAGRPPASGEIDLPLIADWPNRPLQKVDPEHGKPSLTRFRVLAYNAADDSARVELEPLTGRSHQLRVHLCALGHPIVGDALYAPPPIRTATTRLLLHACALRVAHPTTGQPLAFASAVPF